MLSSDHSFAAAWRPRISVSPTSTRSSGGRTRPLSVAFENRSMCLVPLVSSWIREAVLQTSPIAVYSSRRSLPTLPETNGPLSRPMPIRKPSP